MSKNRLSWASCIAGLNMRRGYKLYSNRTTYFSLSEIGQLLGSLFHAVSYLLRMYHEAINRSYRRSGHLRSLTDTL